MMKTRKYIVKKQFEGVPKQDDFEIVEFELPALQDGEILVKTEWVSVDPYQRSYNQIYPTPYDQFGLLIGIVKDTKNPKYLIDTRVVTFKGWCEYSIVNPNKSSNIGELVYKLPDLKGLSPFHGLSSVSFVGATAYFGFLEICKPKAGETVVVTGAAGAVGSIVGQIAKIKGCKVIGFAGSDEKVNWLQNTLGFDRAYNYKTANINETLKVSAPNGVDCYFDNVGGEISSIIMSHMNEFGRVSVCGSISAYNDDVSQLSRAPLLQFDITMKQLKVEGFMVFRWFTRFSEAFAELTKWILEGKLKTNEHITEGFAKIYDAFVGMLAGENIGKAIVKI